MAYEGPGNVDELSTNLKSKWQDELTDVFNTGINIAKHEMNPPSAKAWIYNPITSPEPGASVADIKWSAFPKRLQDNFGTKIAAWREADTTRARHEEYCEWEVARSGVNVERVTFTTEVPEYYAFLFEHDQNLLIDLYRAHVSSQVTISDLEHNGRYNRQNKWNMPELQGGRGVLMHMGYGPNTLGAAVNLAAEATWPSANSQGDLITDEQGLINCRGFGDPARHSDPHIGAQINSLTRLGNAISFDGPTGLYIDQIDLSGFETPDGSSPEGWKRVVRGDDDHMMRVVFEAPKGSGYTLSDLKIDGNKVLFGGQIAEKLTIRIRGLATPANEVPPTINCSGQPVGVSLPILNLQGESTRRVIAEDFMSPE